MTNPKNDAGNGNSLPTLRIGSRVRCTEDGMEGRITWANGVALKIYWDDGEQVTWRRDSLAEQPIVILETTGQDGEAAEIAVAADGPQASASEPSGIEPAANPTFLIEPTSLIAVLDIPRPADMVSEPIVEPKLPPSTRGEPDSKKAQCAGRGSSGTGRSKPGHELPRNDSGHGCQRILDLAPR